MVNTVDIVRRIWSLIQVGVVIFNTITVAQEKANSYHYYLVTTNNEDYYLSTDQTQTDYEDCHTYSSKESAESELETLYFLQDNDAGYVIQLINAGLNSLRGIIQVIFGHKVTGKYGDALLLIEAYQTILSFFSYAFANAQVGFKTSCVSYVLDPELTFYSTIFLFGLTVACSIQILRSLSDSDNPNLKDSFIIYTIILSVRVLINGLKDLMQKIQDESEAPAKILLAILAFLILFLGFSYIGFCICLVIALFTQAKAQLLASISLSVITGQIGVIFEKIYNNSGFARVGNF